MENKNKSLWSDAAKYGGIIGLVVFTAALLNAVLNVKLIIPLLELITVVFLMRMFTLKHSARYSAAEGYSYSQSLGFMMVMMIFAGIISGFGNFILNNYMFPEKFEAAMEAIMDNNMYGNSPGFEQGITMARKLMKNPIYQMFSGIMGMAIYGGLIGLVVAAFTKRKPDIFAAGSGDTGSNENDNATQE